MICSQQWGFRINSNLPVGPDQIMLREEIRDHVTVKKENDTGKTRYWISVNTGLQCTAQFEEKDIDKLIESLIKLRARV